MAYILTLDLTSGFLIEIYTISMAVCSTISVATRLEEQEKICEELVKIHHETPSSGYVRESLYTGDL